MNDELGDLYNEHHQHSDAFDRLVTVVAQLADRVTIIEEYLEISHPPAPWIVDTSRHPASNTRQRPDTP